MSRRGDWLSPSALALVVLGVAGCGTAGPTVSDLRQTIEAYLSAKTPSARCSFYSTTFRTTSPGFVLAGGCERAEEMTTAAQAARLSQKILRIHMRGRDRATVNLTAVPPRLRPVFPRHTRGSTTTTNLTWVPLVSIDLVFEAGKWSIDGEYLAGSG